ncbi:alpha/beta-hydrolase [Periconia macrospinosa]|uniref:Alpha/beta-hydrolase n=1 Tax=Periconia macrospinosa TaxID=97972 RepID=A0A2V1D7L9_9PLEO|nr:alpha/beta-hydrolase [Periconia macrospinosa]
MEDTTLTDKIVKPGQRGLYDNTNWELKTVPGGPTYYEVTETERPIALYVHHTGGGLFAGNARYSPFFQPTVRALLNVAIGFHLQSRLLSECSGTDILKDTEQFWDYFKREDFGHSAGAFLATMSTLSGWTPRHTQLLFYPMLGPLTRKPGQPIVDEAYPNNASELALKFMTDILERKKINPLSKDAFYAVNILSSTAIRSDVNGIVLHRSCWTVLLACSVPIEMVEDQPIKVECSATNEVSAKALWNRLSPDGKDRANKRGIYYKDECTLEVRYEKLQVQPPNVRTTYIVHGTEDTLVPFPYSERYKRGLEEKFGLRTELFLFKGKGHAFDYDKPLEEVFNEVIQEWLEEKRP